MSKLLAASKISDVPTIEEFDLVFGNIVQALLGFAGIALFVMLLVGGIRYITAGGDPKGVEAAQKTLTTAIGGLVLIALAFIILKFISDFTGVDVTNFRIFQPN